MLIGLTGGIGSGKSIVADLFAKKGFFVVDADKISKTIYLKGEECYYKLVEAFGEDILNSGGEIDRKKLKEKAFTSKENKIKLEKLTHYYILEEMLRQKVKGYEEGFKHVVFDAPLLLESGLYNKCDIIIVVDAPVNLRIKRTVSRDGLSEEDIKRIISMQKTIDEFKQYADYIIINDSDFETLRGAVDKVIFDILAVTT